MGAQIGSPGNNSDGQYFPVSGHAALGQHGANILTGLGDVILTRPLLLSHLVGLLAHRRGLAVRG